MMEFMHLIIGDIIHLIGYYPNNRPTTTTQRPLFDSGGKPHYQYPHNQNDWNYESNHIPHGPVSSSSYPTYHSPVSTAHKPQNNYNYNTNNNNNNNYGGSGYLDDGGYQLTPSPIVSQNDYNRPQATPSRPLSTNGYQNPDYDEGYNYGSYQGIETDLNQTNLKHLMNAQTHDLKTDLTNEPEKFFSHKNANLLLTSWNFIFQN